MNRKIILGLIIAFSVFLPISTVFADIQNTEFPDPLGGLLLEGFIEKVINWLLGLVGLLALLALIVGGMRMIVAFGNENSVASAKKIILWAVIGLIVVILAYTIIAIVRNLLGLGT